jgi:hypothetical protein
MNKPANSPTLEPGPLRLYVVTIGEREPFEAMAHHSVDVVIRHAALCEVGEKMDVREVQRG